MKMRLNMSHADILKLAEEIARYELSRPESITSTDEAIRYITAALRNKEHEIFAVLFLDNRHRVIAFEEMFRGTIDGAPVHIREVAKTALKHNAAALIFAHNHPSGCAEPSRADISITRRLQEALGLLDIRVLDHIIVGESTYSFAGQGAL